MVVAEFLKFGKADSMRLATSIITCSLLIVNIYGIRLHSVDGTIKSIVNCGLLNQGTNSLAKMENQLSTISYEMGPGMHISPKLPMKKKIKRVIHFANAKAIAHCTVEIFITDTSLKFCYYTRSGIGKNLNTLYVIISDPFLYG